MQPSMELRWFLAGAVPAAVQQWFSQGEIAPQTEARRTDHYLHLPACEDVGIKQRQGRMEIKRRLAERSVQTFAKGIAGRIEQWVKWSFVLDEQQLPDLTKPTGSWVSVEKVRQLKKFAITPDGTITASDASDRIAQGCNFELTTLVLDEKEWWSLGFEAFGELATVETNLTLTLKQVLSDPDFPLLQAEDSFAYPHWLRLMSISSIKQL